MNKKILIILIGLIVALGVLTFSTSPSNSPLLLLMVPIIISGCVVGLSAFLLLTRKGNKSRARTFYFPVAAGLLSSLVIVMSSLGQLNPTTWSLLAAFALLFTFYVGKSKK